MAPCSMPRNAQYLHSLSGPMRVVFFVIYSRGKLGLGEKMIYKFGYDLKPRVDRPLSTRIGGVQSETATVFQIDKNLYHISSTTRGIDKAFFLQNIDTDQLGQSLPVELDRFQTAGKSAQASTTAIIMARDTSRVSFVYSIPSRRKENEAFGVNVFDRNMNKLWHGTFELPYENRLLELENYEIDVEGTVIHAGQALF